ncbi:Adenylyl-sulfate kinase [Symbiodinium microadriaticum]|uniref:adenylyl-sulfate kinase n=1 Tax=Symbiodinium microadriaticum TaxID=2951 RepID=A0A1Q9EVC4_SYMMI|nr:Adenylyl-sulfate kinase [Symbiodinium microadriaticum]
MGFRVLPSLWFAKVTKPPTLRDTSFPQALESFEDHASEQVLYAETSQSFAKAPVCKRFGTLDRTITGQKISLVGVGTVWTLVFMLQRFPAQSHVADRTSVLLLRSACSAASQRRRELEVACGDLEQVDDEKRFILKKIILDHTVHGRYWIAFSSLFQFVDHLLGGFLTTTFSQDLTPLHCFLIQEYFTSKLQQFASQRHARGPSVRSFVVPPQKLPRYLDFGDSPYDGHLGMKKGRKRSRDERMTTTTGNEGFVSKSDHQYYGDSCARSRSQTVEAWRTETAVHFLPAVPIPAMPGALAHISLLAGLLLQGSTVFGADVKSTNIKFHEGLPREEKWKSNGHMGITLWMTGLSGSGKSTISVALERALVEMQPKSYFVYRLDGDNLRFGLNRDLGFSPSDRKENVRRVSEVSRLFAEAGAIVIAGLISPYAADREYAREVHKNASLPFMEVFVDAPLAAVESRDPKGLYKKAREGKIKGFTGIDAPYEKPVNAEVHVRTDQLTVVQCVNVILKKLDEFGIHLQQTFRQLDESTGECAAVQEKKKEEVRGCPRPDPHMQSRLERSKKKRSTAPTAPDTGVVVDVAALAKESEQLLLAQKSAELEPRNKPPRSNAVKAEPVVPVMLGFKLQGPSLKKKKKQYPSLIAEAAQQEAFERVEAWDSGDLAVDPNAQWDSAFRAWDYRRVDGLGVIGFDKAFDDHFQINSDDLKQQPEAWGMRVDFLWKLWLYIKEDLTGYAAAHKAEREPNDWVTRLTGHASRGPAVCDALDPGICSSADMDLLRASLGLAQNTASMPQASRYWDAGLALVLNAGSIAWSRKCAGTASKEIVLITCCCVDLQLCAATRRKDNSAETLERCWVVFEAALAHELRKDYNICLPDDGDTDCWNIVGRKLEKVDVEACKASNQKDKQEPLVLSS